MTLKSLREHSEGFLTINVIPTQFSEKKNSSKSNVTLIHIIRLERLCACYTWC